ncbi:MAG: hypothetical protein M1831_000558 [Alyxoria varia]|nr:MAG: hypothetical protein M1831_000558 [Alyxoria varia]
MGIQHSVQDLPDGIENYKAAFPQADTAPPDSAPADVGNNLFEPLPPIYGQTSTKGTCQNDPRFAPPLDGAKDALNAIGSKSPPSGNPGYCSQFISKGTPFFYSLSVCTNSQDKVTSKPKVDDIWDAVQVIIDYCGSQNGVVGGVNVIGEGPMFVLLEKQGATYPSNSGVETGRTTDQADDSFDPEAARGLRSQGKMRVVRRDQL